MVLLNLQILRRIGDLTSSCCIRYAAGFISSCSIGPYRMQQERAMGQLINRDPVLTAKHIGLGLTIVIFAFLILHSDT